jgi:hypothetical protein
MTIDLRASVACNLGRVISGNLGDDYIQGNGLVKTQGSVLIDGLISPSVGSQVVFTYVKQGVPRRIPRMVRVLSSFADPIRQTTQVELGCKLTYLSDLVDPIDWTAFSDPDDVDLTEDDARIITVPIKASTVMNKCLRELGLSASSVPLTNNFSIATFDFSPGYVQILSDLLVSESYFGYLDNNEVLQVRSLAENPSSSALLTQQGIIDLGPIGVGPLPAETVTVSYSTLKLKNPDPEDDPDRDPETLWELTTSESDVEASISYNKKNLFGKERTVEIIRGRQETATKNFYKKIKDRDVVVKTNTATTTITAAVAGSYIAEIADYQGSLSLLSPWSLVATQEQSIYEYNSSGDEIRRVTSVYKSEGEVVASTGVKYAEFARNSLDLIELRFGITPSASALVNSIIFPNSIPMEISRTIVETEVVGDYSKVITKEYLLPSMTLTGQQRIAAELESIDNQDDMRKLVNSIRTQKLLVLANTTIDVSRKGVNTSQERPTGADLTNGDYADGGDPNNGWRTESKAELVLAVGSATAQRRIEFSLPYAPDDIFSGPSDGPFTAIPSDAKAKALNYGRIQNRLLLGNRSGISIQAEPERMPQNPYDGIVISAAGYAALYRVNATQWAFDASGVVCSADALYWGLVGTT